MSKIIIEGLTMIQANAIAIAFEQDGFQECVNKLMEKKRIEVSIPDSALVDIVFGETEGRYETTHEVIITQ